MGKSTTYFNLAVMPDADDEHLQKLQSSDVREVTSPEEILRREEHAIEVLRKNPTISPKVLAQETKVGKNLIARLRRSLGIFHSRSDEAKAKAEGEAKELMGQHPDMSTTKLTAKTGVPKHILARIRRELGLPSPTFLPKPGTEPAKQSMLWVPEEENPRDRFLRELLFRLRAEKVRRLVVDVETGEIEIQETTTLHLGAQHEARV